MRKIYCIYTDAEISEDHSNNEHIIPLSLGGSNDFVIPVSTAANSSLGSAIDGKLANDFLIQLLRKKYDVKGHSKGKIEIKLKKSKIAASDSPIHVTWAKDEIIVYDPRAKKRLDQKEYDQMRLESRILLDRFIRVKFTAKVLLAAGYFVYGELFRSKADHKSLRDFMNEGINYEEEEPQNSKLGLYDPFTPVQEQDKSTMEYLKFICKYVNSSCVIFGLGPENIVGTVGILGELVGTINFKADTTDFPNDEDYRLGHIIHFHKGRLIRLSYYDIAVEMGKGLGLVKTET